MNGIIVYVFNGLLLFSTLGFWDPEYCMLNSFYCYIYESNVSNRSVHSSVNGLFGKQQFFGIINHASINLLHSYVLVHLCRDSSGHSQDKNHWVIWWYQFTLLPGVHETCHSSTTSPTLGIVHISTIFLFVNLVIEKGYLIGFSIIFLYY